MILFETDRLIVKPTSLDNLENIYALYSTPDVMRYTFSGVKTYEEVTDFMNEMIKHQAKHGFSSGDIFEKETDTFVGRGGLIYLEMKDDQPDVEIGYILHKQFWGKGYATELARTFLDWGFKNLPVERILASVLPENKNSRHVVEKIGMNYIGNRQCWGSESAVYEILKT